MSNIFLDYYWVYILKSLNNADDIIEIQYLSNPPALTTLFSGRRRKTENSHYIKYLVTAIP